MPAAAGALVLKDSTFTVDDDPYANQVAKVRFVPDTPIQTYRTLVPDGAQQDVDSPTWTLELSGLQINANTGLAYALRNAASGAQLEVVFAPKAGTGNPQVTATVIALPVEFGGEQGKYQTMEIVLPVVGAPVFGTVPA